MLLDGRRVGGVLSFGDTAEKDLKWDTPSLFLGETEESRDGSSEKLSVGLNPLFC